MIRIGLCLAFDSKQNAKEKSSRFAIQNVQTGKNLRPFEAGKANGNKLVLYHHHRWKCMTWELIKVENETFRMQNQYTLKSFQTAGQPVANAKLLQQPLTDKAREWELIKQSNDEYLIKLKGTELYISISKDETNSEIILLPRKGTKDQLWRLVKQNPII